MKRTKHKNQYSSEDTVRGVCPEGDRKFKTERFAEEVAVKPGVKDK